MHTKSYLNHVEQIGIIKDIRVSTVKEKKMAEFTVMTQYSYKKSDFQSVLVMTHVSVTAFEGRFVKLDGLEEGSVVHFFGRLRNKRYTTNDGISKYSLEVFASAVERLENTELYSEGLNYYSSYPSCRN